MIASRAAAALPLLLLLAPAQDDQAKRIEDYRRALAKPNLRLAGWCHARDLKHSARRFDEMIVKLDPEAVDSRIRLGHRREGTGWVTSGKPLPSVSDRWTPDRLKQYVKERDLVLAESAALAREYAHGCATAGLEKETPRAWYEVLRYLPADPEARTALGYESLDVSWTSRPLRSRAEREAWLAKEVTGRAWKAAAEAKRLETVVPTRWQTAPGNRLNQAASAGFTVDATHSKDDAERFLARCLSSQEAVLRLGLVPEEAVSAVGRWNFILLDSKESYESVVRWATENDARKRAYYLSLASFYPGPNELLRWDDDRTDMESAVAHKVAEHLAVAATPGKDFHWYSEGSAGLAVEALGLPMSSRCVSNEGSSVDSRAPRAPKEWGRALLDAISTGREREMPVLLKLATSDFDDVALLQSWSLLWWMREVDPARLREFMKQMLAHGDPENACLNAFGCPAIAVERAWRDWIRAQWVGVPAPKAPITAPK